MQSCGTPLIFITGKGGVGKTTTASALAGLFASREERVALVSFVPERIATLFAAKSLSYEGTPLAPHITGFLLDPHRAFEDFATMRIGSRRIYKTMFDNRFVHYFLDATPGLNELVSLGKIWSMLREGDWDRIIVDLPATGHGLGFLEVPRILTDVVHRGPLYDLGRNMRATLHDAETTTVVIVSRCEELPVNEAVEIAQRLKQPLQMDQALTIANRVRRNPIPEGVGKAYNMAPAPYIAATAFLRDEWEAQEIQRKRLVTTFGDRLREIPESDLDPGAALREALTTIMAEWAI